MSLVHAFPSGGVCAGDTGAALRVAEGHLLGDGRTGLVAWSGDCGRPPLGRVGLGGGCRGGGREEVGAPRSPDAACRDSARPACRVHAAFRILDAARPAHSANSAGSDRGCRHPAEAAGAASRGEEHAPSGGEEHAAPAAKSGAKTTPARAPRKTTPAAPPAPVEPVVPAVLVRGLTKLYGGSRALDGVDLTVPAGGFYGLVGPNGAGKTTTLSLISGLLTPDEGSLQVAGVDAAADPREAKRLIGVLPDRLQTFDRLTGRQLLYYCGVLRGLDPSVVESRSADLARAFDLTGALNRAVSDYSAGMTKKIMLAGAMIHSPRVLVLDEPFEAVDPVSSAVILDILKTYVDHGGTVVLSSHGIDLIERVCTTVAVLVGGRVLAEGSVAEVRGEMTLEERYVELAGGSGELEGLEWLHTFSD